jgi:hypothetical protein
MKEKVISAKPTYEKPAIQVLGSVGGLTLGSKWQSISDLQSGQIGQGPGS